MAKAWRVKKWDGKDVDHKKPLAKWWKTTKKNIRVVSRKTDRKGWAAIANKKKWKGYKKAKAIKK